VSGKRNPSGDDGFPNPAGRPAFPAARRYPGAVIRGLARPAARAISRTVRPSGNVTCSCFGAATVVVGLGVESSWLRTTAYAAQAQPPKRAATTISATSLRR
jgi:hypothetical protein